jgi:TetR/AcrR family fatty acid metabolism transcriptional regulator
MKSRNGDKYHRIIHAATKVFAKKGFFHAKVSDIAREAQVADGTIYLYFENKDDILISLFEEQMKAVLDNMIEELSKEKDAVKKIERFALTHLRLIELNKNMAEIIAKRAFFGALDEMSRFWVLSSHKKYDIETAAKQISEYFLNGLIRDPARS